MAISKEKKKDLVEQYINDLKSSASAVVIQQTGVPVSIMTQVRKDLTEVDWKLNVVRKRLFMRATKAAKLEDISLDELEGSIAVLYAGADEYGPLKAINKAVKQLKKEFNGWSSITFLGGWFEKSWKWWDYVSELANIPSREELLSKLVYLLNYPVQSFAATLNQITEKGDGGLDIKEEKTEEKKEEVKEEKEESE